MEQVLIIKLSALGDIVQAEGAIHDIRQHHLDAEITVLTTAPYLKIMERCPWIDTVLIDPRSSWHRVRKVLALRKKLRTAAFDIIYDLQQVDRTRLYKHLFLHDTLWMGDSTGCTYYCRRPKNRSAADHFFIHLSMAGIKPDHTLKSNISWMAADISRIASTHKIPDNFIALLPGGSKEHPKKRWPYYRELALTLLDNGLTPVTIPGPDEMELCSAIPGIVLTDGKKYLDYFQLAGVLQQAAFVVGNDSGPTHIGAHLGVAGLALFSGHTSAGSTGIQHTAFKSIEVEDLRQLTLSQVWQNIELQLELP